MIHRTPVYNLPMPEENDNYSLSIVNEVTQKTEEALVGLGSAMSEKVNTDGSSKIMASLKVAGVSDPETDYFLVANNSSGAVSIEFSSEGSLKSYLNFFKSGALAIGSTSTIQVTNSVASTTDAVHLLGSPSRRWKDGYFLNSPIVGSDRRIKKDISPLETQIIVHFLQKLTPVQFKYINGTSGRTHFGFIAQDVEDAMASIGLSDLDFAGLIKSPEVDENGVETGNFIYALRQEEFIPSLVKGWQNHEERITELEKRLMALEGS